VVNLGASLRRALSRESIGLQARSGAADVVTARVSDGDLILNPEGTGGATVTVKAGPDARAARLNLRVRVRRGPAPTASARALIGSSGRVRFAGAAVDIAFRGIGQSGTPLVRFFGDGGAEAGTSAGGGASSQVAPGDFASASDYRWEMDAGGVTFGPETELRFRVGAIVDAGIGDPGAVQVLLDDNGDGDYQEVDVRVDRAGTPEDVSDDVIVASGFTTLGTFRFASNDSANPLPVELARFEAARSESGIVLSWKTASEAANAGFAVQRSHGGSAGWTRVGFVDGAGTTSRPQSYRFTDADLPFEADSLRYRLRQVDADGSANVSRAITVERGEPAEVKLLGTAPNPVRSRARVRYAVPEDREVRLQVYDVLGRRVETVAGADAEAGRNEVQLSVEGLSSGVYVLRLEAGEAVRTQRLTVVQ
jgi:hypothetical protein